MAGDFPMNPNDQMNCQKLKLFSETARAMKVFLAMPLLFLAQIIFGFEADTPVTPGASREAQSLLTFFSDSFGKKIISGQQDGWWRTNGLSRELNYIPTPTANCPRCWRWMCPATRTNRRAATRIICLQIAPPTGSTSATASSNFAGTGARR